MELGWRDLNQSQGLELKDVIKSKAWTTHVNEAEGQKKKADIRENKAQGSGETEKVLRTLGPCAWDP